MYRDIGVERHMATLKAIPFAALALMACLASPSAATACNSGPDYCTDDPRIAAALAAKKQALKNDGYPDRLVGLLDLGVQCVARIRDEPDGFRVIDIAADGSKTDLNWDEDEEQVARGRLTSGASVRYWIVNSRRGFRCDGQKPYDQRPDYDAAANVSSETAIKCRLQGGAPVCTR